MSTTELTTTTESTGIARKDDTWTLDQLIGQTKLVHSAMKQAMRPGEHYGVIPGTNSKPSLLKPGAEKLLLLFQLAPEYRVERRDLEGGHVEYEVICRLSNMRSGAFVGEGVGLCSTMESKYRWRGGSFTCPTCGAETIIKGKSEYGGGWLCWQKKGGCGAKFPDSQFSGTPERVENPDIADQFNTVLKMAKKRALVDAVVSSTAASDIFTQDIGDPEHDDKQDYHHEEMPQAGNSASSSVNSGAQQKCPACGSGVWDNRVGKNNPKAPDWKCKNRQCTGGKDGSPWVSWEEDPFTPPKDRPQQSPPETPQYGPHAQTLMGMLSRLKVPKAEAARWLSAIMRYEVVSAEKVFEQEDVCESVVKAVAEMKAEGWTADRIGNVHELEAGVAF